MGSQHPSPATPAPLCAGLRSAELAAGPTRTPTPNLLAPPANHAKMTARRQGNHQKRHRAKCRTAPAPTSSPGLGFCFRVVNLPRRNRSANRPHVAEKPHSIVHRASPSLRDAVPCTLGRYGPRPYPFLRPRVLIPSHFSGAEQPWHIYLVPRPPGRRFSLPPSLSSSRPPTLRRRHLPLGQWPSNPRHRRDNSWPRCSARRISAGFADLVSKSLNNASFVGTGFSRREIGPVSPYKCQFLQC